MQVPKRSLGTGQTRQHQAVDSNQHEETALASWIVLDWDQDQFHLVAAQSTRRGIQVTKAVTWTHPEPFTPSTAERVGHALREFLKANKIAAAPVIVGLSRDRIFMKELRFPAIEAHEEANLVRFQTGKELTESIDHFAVDYVHLNGTGANDERQVMTVAARRDMLTMLQVLCVSAGLKLHAVTPRIFGLGQAVARAVSPDPNPLVPTQLNAVLYLGQRWAELCFFKGERLMQAQALANGPLLLSEIKRNLAVFQAQYAVNLELSGPDTLYVFGENGAVLQTLQAGQHLPIRLLDPLADEAKLSTELDHPGNFAGGAGLALIWSQAGPQKPVNLATPKKGQAPVTVTRQRGLFYGVLIGGLLAFFICAMWFVLYKKRSEIEDLNNQQTEIENKLKMFAQERADIEAYKDWEQTTIPWIDELYDLSARYPFREKFRINQMSLSAVGTKKGIKDQYVGKIAINGMMPEGNTAIVDDLRQRLANDKHLQPKIERFTKQAEYHMKVDVAKQKAELYSTKLVVPDPIIIVKKVKVPAEEPKKDAEPKEPDPEPDPEAKDGGGR
jgi:hypothetical protein